MTLRSLLDKGADSAIALRAPTRQPLNYVQLRRHVDTIGRQLAGQGLQALDRVAIVLPNGPEMASSFLAVASYMSAAPLNPNYKRNEYEFYLSDLKPALVIVEQGSDNPVSQAAAALTAHGLDKSTYENKLVFLMGVEKARFRNPVIPDCKLELKIEAIRSHGRVWKYKGDAFVNDLKMADAIWSATIVDRK